VRALVERRYVVEVERVSQLTDQNLYRVGGERCARQKVGQWALSEGGMKRMRSKEG